MVVHQPEMKIFLSLQEMPVEDHIDSSLIFLIKDQSQNAWNNEESLPLRLIFTSGGED